MKSMESAGRWLPVLLVAGLAACGGGGGGSGGGNQAPDADAGGDINALARAAVSLNGSGSDSDGSVASYAWTQTAGSDVDLSGADGAELTFTAPDVDAAQTLTFELQVTDDEGRSATDSVNVTVLPAVALDAKAYDGPLAGATVTVTVGETTYTATADADGAFELAIGSPDPDTMITIVATGAAGQEGAELISIAGTFGALAAAAGEDNIVDASDSGAVNVTNLSTAKAVLMIEANGGDAPADDTALAELEKSVNADAMLELATVIKLVIDEGIALPEGVNSTLDLVQDNTAVDSVIAAAEEKSAGLFGDTLNAILTDPELTPSFSAGSMPNLYFVNRAGHYIYANRGYFLELKQDGTGQLYGNGSDLSGAFDWEISNGTLKIALNDGDYLTQHLNCTVEGASETCIQTTTDISIRMLSDGIQTDTISVTHSGTMDYTVSNDLDGPFSNTYNRLGMAPGSLKKFAAADVTGSWSVPLSTINTLPVGAEYETGILAFNADGTGTREKDGVTFDWAIDDEGVLSIGFTDGDQLDVYWLRDEGEEAIDAMFVMNTDGGETYAVPTLAAPLDTELDIAETDADGVWDYFDNAGLAYELNSATDVAIARYFNLAGEVTAEYPGELAFDGSTFTVISWYDGFDSVADCDGVAVCFKGYTSAWWPLSEEADGRIYVLEVDDSWAFDGGSPGTNYQGAREYHHAQNRWLQPVATEVAGVMTTLYKPVDASADKRGTYVRKVLGGEYPMP